ncbi:MULTISPECIES: hypothetical protein [unclassified Nocardiopsis]|uniref:hypothetical protein n=1 Tax=unclassified Nocardiopsis TaxID=2649073 RepID=UPI00066C4E91|nr:MULTISPECIES: hypothetical protein [unclassified Nocardiopsis]MBQ1081970.1 hypothetical protein [Nocardiopsis sp. B62]
MNPTDSPTPSRRKRPGLPFLTLVLLALLAAPRVVLHDLGIIQEGTLVNAVFVFVPPLVWIAVVLWRRVPNPFLTLLVVGVLYGLFLMVGHQILWTTAWDGDPPTLGGNLSELPPAAHAMVTRGFAALSSVVTGTLVGAVCGLLAWGASRVIHRRRRAPSA